MNTVVLYKTNSEEIIYYQSDSKTSKVSPRNAEVYMERKGLISDLYTIIMTTEFNISNMRHVIISNGSLINKPESLDIMKQNFKDIIKLRYEKISNGLDPLSDKYIYIDCLVGDTTYRMNAGKIASMNMDDGVRLAIASNLPTMPVVRDFYNTNHSNVTIEDATEIRNIQSQDAMNYWIAKSQLIDQINSAESRIDIITLDLNFPINVEA